MKANRLHKFVLRSVGLTIVLVMVAAVKRNQQSLLPTNSRRTGQLTFSAQEADKWVPQWGGTYISQKGSHRKYRTPDRGHVVIPMHKRDLGKGLASKILKRFGCSINDLSVIRKRF